MTEQINDPDRLEWPDWVIHVEPAGASDWSMQIDGDLLGGPVQGTITVNSLVELHRLALSLGGEAWRAVPNPTWRTGRRKPRNLYIHPGDADEGLYVGVVDWPGLATEICDAMNQRTAVSREA